MMPVMALEPVVTMASGMLDVVNPVVFEAGTHDDELFRKT
jgi:hypothetical protein